MITWKAKLKSKGLLVNKWEIQYVDFHRPNTRGQTPIVILGGAFQRFESFRRDVELLYQYHPVYLVDLPGQGGNNQLAPNLSFEDYAHLLKGFVDRLGLKKIIPVSLSFGSAIGFHFARLYPYHTERLIMAGTTPKLRPSVARLLEESLGLLEQGRHDEFAQAVVLNLMNYSRRKEMRGSEILARGLYRNMRDLTEQDRLKYRHNTERLLCDEGLTGEAPEVETLVVAGEWDHFTTPYECFQVARSCPRGVLAIVAEADHLAPYLKKEMVNQTYLAFLDGERLHSRQGLIVYRQHQYPEALRQMEPRFRCSESAYLDAGNGMTATIEIEDLNVFGCRLRLGGVERTLLKEQDLRLCLNQGQLSLGILPFREDALTVSALFKRTQFKLMHEMEKYLANGASSSTQLLRVA